MTTALEASLAGVAREARAVLEKALNGGRITVADGVLLSRVTGPDMHALVLSADALRREQVGDAVTYVVNRNINFTNLCVKACKFCAFSRTGRSEEGYYLDTEEIVRRVLQAQALGATEVCIQAGLPPRADKRVYLDLLAAVKAAAPAIHVHAFSPEEVKYGAELMGVPVRAYLEELKALGLGSIPGTSAEILDDRVRKRLAGGRITTAEWIEVISTAHALCIPTTATIMYGHIETDEERIRHVDLLRSMQEETGGFTELVPLSFVHAEAPLTLKQMLPDVRKGPTGNEVTRFMAICRLMIGPSFRNLQTSWVKEGLSRAQLLLDAGANDLGGTLMNESISTSAGALHGQLAAPKTLHSLIRDAGRQPVQRNTRYEALATFSTEGGDDPVHPLDVVDDPEATFGTYKQLTAAAVESRAQERAKRRLAQA
jgi:7,8-didemethyl-8-hydroxy-5-deazariboflavin synthase CofH subunit